MRIPKPSLLLSALAACSLAGATACEKNVQEVRRPVYNRFNDDSYAGIKGNPSGYTGSPNSGYRGSPDMTVASPRTSVGSPAISVGSPGMSVGSPGMSVGSPGMSVGSPVTGSRTGATTPHGAPKSIAGTPRAPGGR